METSKIASNVAVQHRKMGCPGLTYSPEAWTVCNLLYFRWLCRFGVKSVQACPGFSYIAGKRDYKDTTNRAG